MFNKFVSVVGLEMTLGHQLALTCCAAAVEIMEGITLTAQTIFVSIISIVTSDADVNAARNI